MLDELYAQGVAAADEILSKVYKVEVRKALNPLHLHDFEILSKSIAHALKGHVVPVQTKALKEAMNVLDAKWTEMTDKGRGKLLVEATKYIGTPIADAVLPKVTQTLKFAAKDIVPATKKNAVLTYDLKINPSLTVSDDRVLNYAVVSQGNFIRDRYGKRADAFGVQAKGIVAAGLSQGLGSADIAENLRGELSMHLGRGLSYWDIIAMTFANRARTMAQLSAYHEAGITSYQWESVLDEVTSDACRFMHGRKFGVGHAMGKFQEVENADDPEAIKQIQPFMQTGNMPDGEGKGIYYAKADGSRAFVARIVQSGVGEKDETGSYVNGHNGQSDEKLAEQGLHAPPIHGRCFPAGVLVEGRFTGGLRATYSGKWIKVVTAGGRGFVVTAKHEVLASKGWVAADALQEGDQVIGYGAALAGQVDLSPSGVAVGGQNDYERPARIEDVFCLLEQARPSILVERSAFDLHGDEKLFDGQVEVVGAECVLRLDVDLSSPQRGDEFGLEEADAGRVAGPGDRGLTGPGGRRRDAAGGGPSGSALLLDLSSVALHPGPFEPLGIGSAAQWDALLDQVSRDRGCGYVETGADLFRRLSGKVEGNNLRVVDPSPDAGSFHALRPDPAIDGLNGDVSFSSEVSNEFASSVSIDQVLEVHVLDSSTHEVFDLQTPEGWFVAGGLVVRNCRSTIIPVESGGGQAAPAEPVEAPKKPTSGQLKASALQSIKDFEQGGEIEPDWMWVKKVPTDPPPYFDHPFFQGPDAPAYGSGWDANKVSKKPKLDDLIPTTPSMDADKLKTYIQKPKALDNAEAPKVVKLDGKYYVVSGHEQLTAQKLMKQKVAYCELVDLDKLKAAPLVAPAVPPPAIDTLGHVIHPVVPATPPSPPPIAPALAHPGAPLEAANVLDVKTGAHTGSNDGGFYTGKDGVQRYVKFYADPTQAQGEHLANTLYRDLGHSAPVSGTFDHEGKKAYASEIVQGLKTLQDAKITPERAKEAMRGFVADVLTGNWDVAGMNLDNMGIDAAGHIVRVDNGGLFLFRAKAGRKNASVLNEITEWENFFTNPAYRQIANAAGYHSAEDMKDLILPEIQKVVDLQKSHGGWASYVNTHAPGMIAKDKAQIVEMLEKRTTLLEQKAHDLKLPAPPDRSQPLIGHLPAMPLPPSELPAPEGGDTAGFRKIVAKRLPKTNHEGVVAFSGSDYKAIRRYDQAKTPEAKAALLADMGKYGYESAQRHAESVEKFFTDSATKPTPCTSYRGIDNISKKDMEAFLSKSELDLLGTTSTSRSPRAAYSFGGISANNYGSSTSNRVLFILKQKSGVAIETISSHEGENEILMHKRARFQITARYKAAGQKNVLIIEAEEVGHGPKNAG